MVFADFPGGAVTDDSYARTPQVTGILVSSEEGREERLHSIRAGEDDPVVGANVQHRLDEWRLVGGRLDPDGRQFVRIGAEFT